MECPLHDTRISLKARLFSIKQDRDLPDIGEDDASPDVSSAEILDDMTTRRGELKHRSMSFNERHQQVRI